MNTLHESIKQLHPIETKILFHIAKKSQQCFSADDIVTHAELVLGQVNQGISWLLGRQLIIEHTRTKKSVFEVTDLGKQWQEVGIPHVVIFFYVKQNAATFSEIATQFPTLTHSDIGSVYGFLSKEGIVSMDAEKRIHVQSNEEYPTILRALEHVLSCVSRNSDIYSDTRIPKEHIDDIFEKFSKKRGAAGVPFRKAERELVTYLLTEMGNVWIKAAKESGITGEEISSLTSQMLKDGSWKNKKFRAYNTNLPPGRVHVGRQHSYAEFLRRVKDKLVSLGFQEFDGPLVETEFWNSDALFMPQFHVARDIHDVYYLDQPTHANNIPSQYLESVASVHENGGNSGSRGWRYSFDKNFTRRLILRSQGTVMSAKTLPKAEIPGKYFGILRVFRHDQIDATHLSDFYQTEGIVLGEDVSLKTLLGLLKIFAEEFAQAEEVKYVPAYFPFTEPSVEVHIKHPDIGWMELGGSGIFRPEVTKPLGIDVPVAAWGIGVDRMATMQMNITDIRELFSFDLEKNILRRGVRI